LTGEDFSTGRLEGLADRIATLERLFNLRAGFKADDDTLPERFIRETIQVEGAARLVPRSSLERLRSDYYAVRGWDEGTGVPRPATLAALGLEGEKL
jgi:aldehyde:ferredoxin oxidoreductase